MWIEKSAAQVTVDDKGQDSRPVVKGPQLQVCSLKKGFKAVIIKY